MESSEFEAAFFEGLQRDSHARVPRVGVLPSAIGATRERWRETPRTRVADAVMRAAGRLGLSSRRFDPEKAAARLEEIAAQLPGLAETHDLLADRRSKDLLLSVLRFRVLGPGHVSLPVSRRRYWRTCEALERDRRLATGVLDTPWNQTLDRYELPGRSGPIRYLGQAQEVAEIFSLEQYAYRHAGVEVAASPGDTVVDGGGGWGETALYFADAVNPDGRVLCFEFVPDNVAVLERNLDENPRLRGQVELRPHPLWSRSGERLSFEPAGPVTSVAAPGGEQAVTSNTIDDLRASHGVRRVDFIKLDVEGAEPAALHGAEETLGSCRPRLAVAVYHRIGDMVEIPRFLAERGYELFLDHVTAGPYETVLFARPRA